MENEIWKDIEGYEGLYQVSNLGRVKSLYLGKERILKPGKHRCGYLCVALCKDGKMKTYKVHRLVAINFIQNSLNLPQVNHKDENKENNCVWNLEWCDNKYNSNYGTRNERHGESMLGFHINRKDQSKKVICVETNTIYPSEMEVQRQTGIRCQHICRCLKGKRKTAGGYHWQYVE